MRARWVYQGGYTGGGTRVGIPGGYREGLYRYPATLLEEGSPDSEAGPGRACRAREWVVRAGRTYRRAGRLLRPPTPAPLQGASGARFAVSGPSECPPPGLYGEI